MAKDTTLHIKVDEGMARRLKSLARRRDQTMGQLVRQAIVASYQTDLLGLRDTQSRALAAYRGGYISIGKLAEVMGMHVLALRHWLEEHDIPQNTALGDNDAANA